MRRLLLLVILAGLLAVHPAFAQNKARRVKAAQAAPAANASQIAAPDALRHDPASTAKPLRDPRPLQGLDTRRPRSRSVDAFRARRGGTVQGITRSGLVRGAQRTLGASQTTPGLSLGAALRLERASNETVRWLRGRLGRAEVSSGVGKKAAYTQAALEVAEAYAGVLGLDDPLDELRSMKTTQDDLGYVHARFEQVYEGLRVWGRDLYVHFDADGEAYALNGTYEPTPAGVATRPSLDETAALRAAVDDLKARGRWAPLPDDVAAWLDIEAPQTELVLYPDPDQGVRLAYDVTLHPNLLERFTYLIDARTGQILGRLERHCTLHYRPNASAPVPTVNGLTRPAATTGAAKAQAGFFDATAGDLNGVEQALRVYQGDDGLFYSIWDLDNLNPASQLPDDPNGGAMTIDANSTDLGDAVNLTHVTSANNTWNDPASVSAHVNMNIAYDYYKNTHGRNAIDGNDQSMISIIHVTDEDRPMDNAFWNGRVMAYGDGDQAFLPLAGGLDVAGHEITHGVIDNTAGLIYQFQSGALNESFADVFGVLIEPNDFLLGEDIMRANFAALRDLLNPDNPNVLAAQPASMSQFVNTQEDNGGVHINSGIPNRAAALIIQILGIQPTEQIYYRALTMYLTRNSQFGDARLALEQAATDLFGENSNAVEAVRNSFDDVGILSTSGEGGDEGNDLPVQTGGTSFVAFMLDDGSIKLLDVTDFGSVSVLSFNDPGAVARVDNDGNDRSQLTTPLDGETLWFINPDGKLAFIETQSGAVSVFANLFLQQEGDLWNASVSPAGDLIALVSAYTNDPNIYILDVAQEQLCTIPLVPETSQEGIENQTIQFPDVISWSPNPQVPRIVFDALNEVQFGTENTISYWSIYEIDYEADDCTASTTFNLVPAQSTEVSVGNITYSKTNPDVIAFNEITETWDVLVGDFETGETEALGFPNFTIDGQNINDAQRPTFSPDDTQLAVSSPDLGVLLFYDLETGDPPPFINLQQSQGSAPYNPHWFVRGGSGGADNQAPTAGFTASATAGPAPLLVTFDAALSNDPDGTTLSYRWNFGDGSAGSGVSASHTFAQGGTVSVTLTVTDSGGLSDTATQQITVSAPSSTVSLRGFDPQQAQTVLQVTNDGGFIMGTNAFEDQAKATVFTLPAGVTSAQITEVNVWFGFKRAASTLDYAIEILDGTPASGPTTVLGREVFPLSGANADQDPGTDETPTNHALAQPVTVGPSFFVSVDFGSYGSDDYLSASIVSTALVGSRVAEVWEKWSDGNWNNVSDSWDFGGGFGVDGALPWIEVVVQRGAPTPVEDAAELPRVFMLASNYPNPFNASTTLQVELPARAEVDLRVIDLLGRTVATLVEGPMEAGIHTVRFDAGGLPSGVYLARLHAGSATMTRKMVLVR